MRSFVWVMAMFVFGACSNDGFFGGMPGSRYAGKWGSEPQGEKVALDKSKSPKTRNPKGDGTKYHFCPLELELKLGGTMTLRAMGQQLEGTWKESGDHIVISPGNGANLVFRLKDGLLTGQGMQCVRL